MERFLLGRVLSLTAWRGEKLSLPPEPGDRPAGDLELELEKLLSRLAEGGVLDIETDGGVLDREAEGGVLDKEAEGGVLDKEADGGVLGGKNP